MITSRYATLHDIELILDETEKGNVETRWNFTFDVSEETVVAENRRRLVAWGRLTGRPHSHLIEGKWIV